MHPVEMLINEFRARHRTTVATDRQPKCKKDGRGHEVPFIVVEGPQDAIGWIALGIPTGADAADVMWIETKRGCERKGHADRMLTELCGRADELRVRLTLQASPWDDAVSLDALIDFYEKHEFSLDAPPRNSRPDQRMTRLPRGARTIQKT